MRGGRVLSRLPVLCLALLLVFLGACAAQKGSATDYGEFTVRTERAREAPETADTDARSLPETAMSATSRQEDYVLNKSSGKFHYPSCSAVGEISEKNRWTYHSAREDVIEMGYQPCKICSP